MFEIRMGDIWSPHRKGTGGRQKWFILHQLPDRLTMRRLEGDKCAEADKMIQDVTLDELLAKWEQVEPNPKGGLVMRFVEAA